MINLPECNLVSTDTYTHFDGRPVTEQLVAAPRVTPETLAEWRWN